MGPPTLDAPFTELELLAEHWPPTPGVWWQPEPKRYGLKPQPMWHPYSVPGDGHPLTQEQTDALIVRELVEILNPDDAKTVAGLYTARKVSLVYTRADGKDLAVEALEQRGGIHSDPMIRVIAARVFGTRDRDWELQPVCAGCMCKAGLHTERRHDPDGLGLPHPRCAGCRHRYEYREHRDVPELLCKKSRQLVLTEHRARRDEWVCKIARVVDSGLWDLFGEHEGL